MNISYRWLSDYVDLSSLSIDELTEIMTEIGLEVEGYEKTESIKGGLEGIIVGKVLECEPHPNADKLSLTRVDVGEEEPLQIVCGAPNVAAGQTVPVAVVGTELYDAEGASFTIKKGKIRGEVSAGMICAEDELGISDDHEGIMILPEKFTVGRPLNEFIKVEQDYIIHVELTPNRADATNHLGVAEDIAAYLNVNRESEVQVSWPETPVINPPVSELPIEIEVVAQEACPRYCGIVLQDIIVQESPAWIQDRLRAIGIAPKNNVVDITNFILHEMGQPLHAFDYEKIEGHKVIVDVLSEGTPFVSLDEQERELIGEELMICDGARQPLCMAGVFGGVSSGVTASTTKVFLESAYFDAKTIRRASMKHNLRTDAAKIYEKGADPNRVLTAMARAISLLKEYASAKVASAVLDTLSSGIAPVEVEVRRSKVNQYLGIDLSEEQLSHIFKSLSMPVLEQQGDAYNIQIPTNKPDVLREVDVIEEIIRIYGLGHIPIPEKVEINLNTSTYPDAYHFKEKVSLTLTGAGLSEAMSLSLVPSSWYDDKDQLVLINNTSNRDLDAMRPDMVMTSVQNVAHNANRQRTDVGLFEFGRTYIRKDEDFRETDMLSIALSGNQASNNWLNPKEQTSSFYHIKSLTSRVFGLMGIEGFQESEIQDDDGYLYGLQWHRGPKVLARFGKIRSQRTKLAQCDQEVFVSEIDWGALVKAAKKQEVTVSLTSRFPTVQRDLALLLPKGVKFADVQSAIYKEGKGILQSVDLFDWYEHEEQLGGDIKSYAVRMVFGHMERTLKDKEIDKLVDKILKRLEKRFGAKLR